MHVVTYNIYKPGYLHVWTPPRCQGGRVLPPCPSRGRRPRLKPPSPRPPAGPSRQAAPRLRACTPTRSTRSALTSRCRRPPSAPKGSKALPTRAFFRNLKFVVRSSFLSSGIPGARVHANVLNWLILYSIVHASCLELGYTHKQFFN